MISVLFPGAINASRSWRDTLYTNSLVHALCRCVLDAASGVIPQLRLFDREWSNPGDHL